MNLAARVPNSFLQHLPAMVLDGRQYIITMRDKRNASNRCSQQLSKTNAESGKEIRVMVADYQGCMRSV